MRQCFAEKVDNGDTMTSVTDSINYETNVQQETARITCHSKLVFWIGKLFQS